MPSFKAGARKNTNEPIFRKREKSAPLAASALADLSKIEPTESAGPFRSAPQVESKESKDAKRKLSLDDVIANFQNKKAKPGASSSQANDPSGRPEDDETSRLQALLQGALKLAAKGMKVDIDGVVANFRKKMAEESGGQDASYSFSSRTEQLIAETKMKLMNQEAQSNQEAKIKAEMATYEAAKASSSAPSEDPEVRKKREMMERIYQKVSAIPGREAEAELLRQNIVALQPKEQKTLDWEEEQVIQKLQAHQEEKKKQDVLEALQVHQQKQADSFNMRDVAADAQNRVHSERQKLASQYGWPQGSGKAADDLLGPSPPSFSQPSLSQPSDSRQSGGDLSQACQELVHNGRQAPRNSVMDQQMAAELQNSVRRRDDLLKATKTSMPSSMPRRRTPAEIIAGVEQAEREVNQSFSELNDELASVRRSPQDIIAGVLKKCGQEAPPPGNIMVGDPMTQMAAEMQCLFPDISQVAAVPQVDPFASLIDPFQMQALLQAQQAATAASLMPGLGALGLPGGGEGLSKLLLAHQGGNWQGEIGAGKPKEEESWNEKPKAKKWQNKNEGKWQDNNKNSGWQDSSSKWQEPDPNEPPKDERWNCWEGDWLCTSCNVICFSWRSNCATCELPKELGAPPPPDQYIVKPRENGWVDA